MTAIDALSNLVAGIRQYTRGGGVDIDGDHIPQYVRLSDIQSVLLKADLLLCDIAAEKRVQSNLGAGI